MNNSIQALKTIIFSKLTLDQRRALKSLGRPLPEFCIEVRETKKSENRVFTRQLYSSDAYQKNDWICGCDVEKSFYCFPCILLSPRNRYECLWVETGCKDVKHLKEKIRNHEVSLSHLNSVIDFCLLDKVNIPTLNAQYRENVKKHNIQVDKNRHVLRRLISCIKFCGVFELPLTDHDESASSTNPGVFRGLINYTADLDTTMKDYLESATVVGGTSKIIQNDILDCMLDVCREEIEEHIRTSEFVAIECDDTTDVLNHYQMVLVFRYVFQGSVCERFWGFFNPEGRCAEALANCIMDHIRPLLDTSEVRLIAQSYDGVNVMSGSVGDVQAKIRETYPDAYFVHCYAHQLHLLLEKATSANSKVRVFFSNLSAIAKFFSHSSLRSDVLEQMVQVGLPRIATRRWNYNIRTVNVVYENSEKLEGFFEVIEKKCTNKQTVNEASSHRRAFQDPDFMFWLTFFHKILPHVDVLYQQLQTRNRDNVTWQNDIQIFENKMQKEKEKINYIEKLINEEFPEQPRKRKNSEGCSTRMGEAKEVCDVITNNVKERFACTGHLEAASLFCNESFLLFSTCFPEEKLMRVIHHYPFLQKEKLRTELGLLYTRQDFNIKGAIPLLNFIEEHNLISVFSEVTKLIKIIVTTPMTSDEPERCLSTLKRIKNFLRNTMTSSDRLNALAMLSINKELVQQMKNFEDRVMENFINLKERRMNFLYK